MCVKLPLGNLNPDPCPTYPISIYTCEVTTAPRVCGGTKMIIKFNAVMYLNLIEEFNYYTLKNIPKFYQFLPRAL